MSETRDYAALLNVNRRWLPPEEDCAAIDLLHIGHIRYLEKAKRLGDILVVTVTPDCYVNKGPHRPAFPDLLRAEAIAALDAVDYVAINEWPTAVETLDLLRPDVYAKGAEFRQNRTPEIDRAGW